MESRLASLLVVLAVAITAAVTTAIHISPALGLALGAISLLALAAWGAFSLRDPVPPASVAGPVLLAIVAVLVLATARYAADLVPAFQPAYQHLLRPGFALTDASWFVVFVVAPVALMLIGACYLVLRSPLGSYMAWWTVFFTLADALLQLMPATLPGSAHGSAAWGVTLLALVQIAVAAAVAQRLLRPHAPAPVEAPAAASTLRQRNLWTLLFVSLVTVYGITLYSQAGIVPFVIVVGSMLGGLVGWRLSTALRPADPVRALPLYLLLLTLFYIHVGEEALTSFNVGIASLSDKPWSDADFTLLIGLLGPVVWFFSAWSLWKRQPFGNFVFWFLIVGMILGEPTHLLVFPVGAMVKFGIGYQYFSGMYTALFPMIPAILALVMILRARRSHAAGSLA
jgi:hypothetical protein